MTTVDLYDVLNISSNCTKNDIRSAYKKLVLIHHPDKGGNSDIFELITHAYTILIDDKKRSDYNEMYELSKKSEINYLDLRKQSQNYYHAKKISNKKKNIDKIKKEYVKNFHEMDKKHNIIRGHNSMEFGKIGHLNDELPEKEALNKFEDIKLIREQDDIENAQEQLFDDHNFNLSKFNAIFDEQYKKSKKSDIIPYNEIAAENDTDSNFLFSNDDYENIYTESKNINSTSYAHINDSTLKSNNPIKDVEKIKCADYTLNHNSITKNYDKDINEKLKERDMETQKYSKMKLGDFDNSFGKFGIFNKLSSNNSIEWDNKKTLQKKYKILLNERKKSDVSFVPNKTPPL